jgi:hypothetical protein
MVSQIKQQKYKQQKKIRDKLDIIKIHNFYASKITTRKWKK